MPSTTSVPARAIEAGVRRFRIAAVPGIRVALLDLGLACCALEFSAAVVRGLLIPDGESPDEGSPVEGSMADPDQRARPDVIPVTSPVLVVSGTVTTALIPAVTAAIASLADTAKERDDCRVLAFGACAISGGPYWDAPTVAPGVESFATVASYVPGCPPRPEALISAIRELAQSPEGGDHGR